MNAIQYRLSRVLLVSLSPLLLVLPTPARADIFQWEYIDPADPSQGKRQSSALAPDGAGVDAVRGANLYGRNMTMAYLIGADLLPRFSCFYSCSLIQSNLSGTNLTDADLTNANLAGAILTDADFTGTEVRGAIFSTQFCGFLGCTSDVTGTGISLDQLYSTASYEAHDLSGIDFKGNDLAGANFSGQTLTSAYFWFATLADADFTGAEVRGALFNLTTSGGFTAEQLYSTASYKAHDLSGIFLAVNDLSGWNFSDQKLTNATFALATLTDADFTAADTRSAVLDVPASAIITNLIWPNGHINGLDLRADRALDVRDYDDAYSLGPIPITVYQHLTMGPGGTLRMVFEADEWDSTISFAPGIPVALGGTLELTFAADVNLASQVGRTFDLFNWTSVTPSGQFAISTPYDWDLSNLYTTGEVTLTAVPEPDGVALTAVGILGLVLSRRTRAELFCIAASRRQLIARGASPWRTSPRRSKPHRGDSRHRVSQNCRPVGADSRHQSHSRG